MCAHDNVSPSITIKPLFESLRAPLQSLDNKISSHGKSEVHIECYVLCSSMPLALYVSATKQKAQLDNGSIDNPKTRFFLLPSYSIPPKINPKGFLFSIELYPCSYRHATLVAPRLPLDMNFLNSGATSPVRFLLSSLPNIIADPFLRGSFARERIVVALRPAEMALFSIETLMTIISRVLS